MEKQEPEQLCGYGGKGKPLYELDRLVKMLERLNAEKRERKEREKKAG